MNENPMRYVLQVGNTVVPIFLQYHNTAPRGWSVTSEENPDLHVEGRSHVAEAINDFKNLWMRGKT